MQIRDVGYWLGLTPSQAVKGMCKIRSVMTGSVRIDEEISLQEAKQLWELFPQHRRVLLITLQPDEEGNDVSNTTMLGDWDGRQMRAADRLFKRSYKNYKQAFIHSKQASLKGHSSKAFRTYPTEEEIAALKAEDEARIAAANLETVVTIPDEPLPEDLEPEPAKEVQEFNKKALEVQEEALNQMATKLKAQAKSKPATKPKPSKPEPKAIKRKPQAQLEAQALKVDSPAVQVTDGVHVISETELEAGLKK